MKTSVVKLWSSQPVVNVHH